MFVARGETATFMPRGNSVDLRGVLLFGHEGEEKMCPAMYQKLSVVSHFE